MSKNRLVQVVLITGGVLIILSVLLLWVIQNNKEAPDVIKVSLEDGVTESLQFESLCLVPGQACEYTLSLKHEEKVRCDLKFDFVETEEKTLKNFARVKMIAGDEVVYDDLLAAAFENENIILPIDFRKGKNTELKIVYYLPIEVGNEAKNAEAVFELQLTASNA